MDGGKKRKKDAVNAEAEEDNEEEKMEKFFALMRSTRDIKERMLMSGNTSRSNVNHRLKALQEEEDVAGKKMGSENNPEAGAVAVWNPIFQPEDFVDDHPTPQPDHHPPPPLQSSSVDPLNLNIIPTATHDDEVAATATTAAAGGGPSSTKTEEDRDQDEDDHYLDLNLSL